MDRALIIEHLQQAERHMSEVREHIRHQVDIIGRLERDGHDSSLARQLLATLEKTQALVFNERNYMLSELADNDAREGATGPGRR